MVVSVSVQAAGIQGVDEYCKDYPPGEINPSLKMELLAQVKNQLLEAAQKAENSFLEAENCFYPGREADPLCMDFRRALRQVLSVHMKGYKTLVALEKAPTFALDQLTRRAYWSLIQSANVSPYLLADYDFSNFSYTEEEIHHSVHTWKTLSLVLLSQEIDRGLTCEQYKHEPTSHLRYAISAHLRGAKAYMLEENPLLNLLDGEKMDEATIQRALEKLRAYNHQFKSLVEEMRVQHKEGVVSQFNLATQDHEMSLVNFPKFALSAIEKMPVGKRADACASWSSLEKQQSARIKSSIGVGFASSVLCGAGVISGFGTVPALILCLPAFADGLWGGYRGFTDSKIAQLSGVSGRSLTKEGTVSGDIRGQLEADYLRRQGRLVLFINLLGLAPIASGVKGATVGLKGSWKSFAKMPVSDSSTSLLEVNSGVLANMLIERQTEETHPLSESLIYQEVEAFAAQCE